MSLFISVTSRAAAEDYARGCRAAGAKTRITFGRGLYHVWVM